MACGNNSKDYIKGLFPDNTTNEISPADLREFVDLIYAEATLKEEINDTLTGIDSCKPLSEAMGKSLTTQKKISLEVQRSPI